MILILICSFVLLNRINSKHWVCQITEFVYTLTQTDGCIWHYCFVMMKNILMKYCPLQGTTPKSIIYIAKLHCFSQIQTTLKSYTKTDFKELQLYWWHFLHNVVGKVTVVMLVSLFWSMQVPFQIISRHAWYFYSKSPYFIILLCFCLFERDVNALLRAHQTSADSLDILFVF